MLLSLAPFSTFLSTLELLFPGTLPNDIGMNLPVVKANKEYHKKLCLSIELFQKLGLFCCLEGETPWVQRCQVFSDL